MTTLDQIKSLMKSGDIAGAEALCRKELEADPHNAELKMRYGICRELLGDEDTFIRIHDELAPEMEKAPTSLWRKYHELWLALIIGALVIAGTAALPWKEIRESFKTMVHAIYAPKVYNNLYAAPGVYDLYAGPPDIPLYEYYEREKDSESE